MEEFWELFIFKLNTGAIYLVPVYSGGEKKAWKDLAYKLSRSEERTKKDCKLIKHMDADSNIVKL